MLIDDQTLRDLEIFQAHGSGPAVFDVLDRTRTRGGREALRRRFRSPYSEPERILAVQRSLEFISAQRPQFNALPSDHDLAGLERYLHSNYELQGNTHSLPFLFEAAVIRFGYRDMYHQIAGGVSIAANVLHALRKFTTNDALRAAPGDLGHILVELGELLAIVSAKGVLCEIPPRRFALLLKTDGILRAELRPQLDRLLQLVYELDALVAMADVVAERSLTFPHVLSDSGELEIRSVTHPFLSSAIANDLQVSRGTRVLLITGPNTAGKSTYLRTCALAIYLGHLGLGVPAQTFRFRPFDTLITSITITDNLRQGVSLFRAETLRIKEVAQAVADGHRVFAVLDEPFKGTNVKDALDASLTVLKSFASVDDCVFLVASHLIELTEHLSASETAFWKFEADDTRALHFDFKLRAGISSQRLGMRVLAEEGVTALLERLTARGV
jgi:DNA mismatch repair protein MutS